jgi:nicotinate-nucleotide--dimethylbenzimidazole phosphoribosyltransferase
VTDLEPLAGIDAVLFDVGGTLVQEAPPLTPVEALVARPLPGVVETLERLARHHRLAAVTDTAVMDEHAVRKLLAPVGIDALLEVVVTSSDVGAAKPDPTSLQAALGRLGVSADRACYIGDGEVDREAARRAGVRFVAVDAGLPDALERARVTLPALPPLDDGAATAMRARQERLTKPAGSLGALEDLSVLLAAIAGRCPPPVPGRPAVAVFAGDHGVVASGVTPWPQDVTAQMVRNFVRGGAAINALARQVGATVHVVDAGVAGDVSDLTGVRHRKVREGTADLAHGPAMTAADVRAAIEVGLDVARDLVGAGHDLLVTGEMGIGNTTPAAALLARFTGAAPERVTGRGTGIDDDTLARKVDVVARAVSRTSGHLDPLSVLAEVGGLEIAALTGFVVGGAAARVPVVVDGVIACAAACAAEALVPGVRTRLVAGHRSVEPGAPVALAHLGLRPLLDLDLRLGEGTGACLAVPIVQAAARAAAEMATFDDL